MPCFDCKLGSQCTRPILQGNGNSNSPKFMFIGDKPGKEDYEQGRAFAGGAGRILSSIIKNAGISRNDCYFTYACRCTTVNNRPVVAGDLRGCSGKLSNELAEIKPSLVISLGEAVTYELTGKSVHTWRGSIVEGINSASGFKVLILYDPLFLMKMRTMYTVTVWDLVHAMQPEEETQENYLVNPNRQILQAYFQECLDNNYEVAVDIETNGEEEDEHKAGLNPWANSFNIIGISFTSSKGQAVHLNNGCFYSNWDLLDNFLSRHPKLIYQNNTFDRCAIMVKRGYLTSCSWDTLNGMHNINSALPKKLDFIRSVYTKLPPYKEIYKTNGKYIPGALGSDALARLNCLDTDVTWQAAQEQKKFVPNEIMQRSLVVDDIAIEMRVRGVLIDKRATAVHYATIIPEIKELEERFKKTYQCSIASPKQLGKLLYDELKLPIFNQDGHRSIRAKGSTNEKAIKAIGEKLGLIYDNNKETGIETFIGENQNKDVLIDILTYRGLSKIASTYCEGVFRALDSEGILHPQWCTSVVDSERFSCRGVAIQGYPKEMRNTIVARPGNIFFGADYKGAQILAAAILAQDWELAEKMLDLEYSLHNEVMELIRPYYPSIQKVQAKSVVFGTFFGRMPPAIAQAFGVPVATAELWQKVFYDSRPKLKTFMEETIVNQWETKGYAEGIQGFKKYTEAITEAKCHPIQNFEAIIARAGLVALKQAGFNNVMMIHDQLVTEEKDQGESINQERFQQFVHILEHVCPEYFHRFPVDGGIGYTWKEV